MNVQMLERDLQRRYNFLPKDVQEHFFASGLMPYCFNSLRKFSKEEKLLIYNIGKSSLDRVCGWGGKRYSQEDFDEAVKYLVDILEI